MRDNEKIIEICVEISKANREYAIQLINSGAPLDMFQGLFAWLEMVESIPERLTNSSHRSPGLGYPMATEDRVTGIALASEVMASHIEDLKTAIAKLPGGDSK